VAGKGPLNKLVGATFGAVKHPIGTAGKTIGLAKETAAVGWMVAEHVTRLVVGKATEVVGGSRDESAPTQEPEPAVPPLKSVPAGQRAGKGASAEPAPAAKAPAKKAPAKKAAKKAPAKGQGDPTAVTPADIAENVAHPAPAKKGTAKKAVAKKSPGKATAAAKAPAKKAAAEAAPAEPMVHPAPVEESAAAAARKTAGSAAGRTAPKTAEEVANVDGPPVTTPVGTTAAAEATNPDTTDHDLQQPGTEPLVDPGTAKALRSEAETLQRAADPDKG
jgi:hypothetical protein